LTLIIDVLLSRFAFKSNSRRYTKLQKNKDKDKARLAEEEEARKAEQPGRGGGGGGDKAAGPGYDEVQGSLFEKFEVGQCTSTL
jgi:hypothetical protein